MKPVVPQTAAQMIAALKINLATVKLVKAQLAQQTKKGAK